MSDLGLVRVKHVETRLEIRRECDVNEIGGLRVGQTSPSIMQTLVRQAR